jgi:predicted ester cyclase
VIVHGKHTGHDLGVAAKGNEVEFSGVTIARLRDGKIAEAWNYFDFASMYKQMR